MLSRQAGAVSSGLSVSGMMFSGVITGRLFNRCSVISSVFILKRLVMSF